jgi:hypothetical protein
MRVTISEGVAVAPHSEGFDQLIALYSAMAAGRNRIVLAKGAIMALTDVRDDKGSSVFDNAFQTAKPKLFVVT